MICALFNEHEIEVLRIYVFTNRSAQLRMSLLLHHQFCDKMLDITKSLCTPRCTHIMYENISDEIKYNIFNRILESHQNELCLLTQ